MKKNFFKYAPEQNLVRRFQGQSGSDHATEFGEFYACMRYKKGSVGLSISIITAFTYGPANIGKHRDALITFRFCNRDVTTMERDNTGETA